MDPKLCRQRYWTLFRQLNERNPNYHTSLMLTEGCDHVLNLEQARNEYGWKTAPDDKLRSQVYTGLSRGRKIYYHTEPYMKTVFVVFMGTFMMTIAKYK
jgi:hypothetical protein